MASQDLKVCSIWDWKDAKWRSFRENMEDEAKQIETLVLIEPEKLSSSAILKADYRNIGLKKVGSTKRIWLKMEIKEAIAYRDSLKPDRHDKLIEIKEADTRVKTVMIENQRSFWKGNVEETKTQRRSGTWCVTSKMAPG